MMMLTNMPIDFQSQELQRVEREHRQNIRIVTARPWIHTVSIGLFVAIDAVMVLFFAMVVVGYVIAGSFTDIRATASLAENAATIGVVAEAGKAEAFVVGTVKVVQGTPSTYDVYTTIQNPNADWYATFTYDFSGSGIVSRPEHGFVMPGEKKYLVSFGHQSETRLASATVTVSDVVWHRVNRHNAPDVAAWLEEHRAMTVTDITYIPNIGFTEQGIGSTSFTVNNTTPYSYWSPQFLVILERAGAVVGIAQATMSNLAAGESRQGSVRWYGDGMANASATVVPTINYFDPDVYMPPQGEQAPDPRDAEQRR